MRRVLADNATGDSFMGWLMGCFAALALLLAGVGIFGVIAYNVAQRTREMGIRMALGAGKGEVLRLVVGQSAWLAGLGIALGMLGAFPLPGLMAGMFNGLLVSAGPVLTIVPLVVAAVSLAASYIPAQRATRVEPMTALRSE
jgi:ABC-type antimicrobial peptide transport system permease subunit